MKERKKERKKKNPAIKGEWGKKGGLEIPFTQKTSMEGGVDGRPVTVREAPLQTARKKKHMTIVDLLQCQKPLSNH